MLPLMPKPPNPPSFFHQCRMLLANMGLLGESSEGRIHYLQPGMRLTRSLKELDKLSGRESMKIGVIYVKEGQETQHSILANDNCSKPYLDFIEGLGWNVCFFFFSF